MSDTAQEDTQAQDQAATETRDFVVAEDSAPQRPEWLPEKYKTPEDLAKAYKQLESKLGSKDEDLRKSIIEELQAEAFQDRPASAGDYQLPDIVDPSTSVDSELLKWWSEHSYENGYSQDEFAKGIEMYMSAMGQQSGPDLEAEAKKLGENANQRISAASAFARKMFGEDQMGAIERLFQGADGILAMETIMEALKDGDFSSNASSASSLSEADLREMMQDPRYWKAGAQDRDFVKKVDDGFRKLYG